ncbi:MAG: monovalent cation/H(+) antiporter subunit G [Rhodospirillaceae bacterium]|nr:monovalent cation/H(+) antiporter subunit G [Rhodospirillaceae bacterium]MBL6931162.1 monovalent cation/H(+) antiporter subunit G [Rhodospirillales bacterium]MBL6940707.1 monovalent cation/H(+) antiporter subunit G [Rhodospirillales bacterium]
MMEMIIDIASWGLFVGGSIFMLIGAIGLIRLPDMFSRIHAAGIIDTMGIVMLFVGMILQAGLTFVSIKIFLITLFLMFTLPTATHALARAALDAGMIPLSDDDDTDEKELALMKELEEERKRISKT